jgi:hypothetical protein
MIRLKKFNESVSEEDVRDFCETNMAYLMDDNSYEFEYFISRDPTWYFRILNLTLEASTRYKWEDVVDHYIPFLYLLNNKYKLCEFNNRDDKSLIKNNEEKIVQFSVKENEDNTNVYKYFSVNQVINNEVNVNNCEIWYISVKVGLL